MNTLGKTHVCSDGRILYKVRVGKRRGRVHLARLPVVSNELMQRVRVGYPAHHTGVMAQRSYRVSLNGQVVTVVAAVFCQKRVDLECMTNTAYHSQEEAHGIC